MSLKKTVLLYILFLPFLIIAQNKENGTLREQYIQRYKDLAISEMKRCGIPASITLAQACLESQNGTSRLATEGNNHFGIKCKSYWTGEKIFHDDDLKGECFRKYKTAEESFLDHSDFLKTSSRYSILFELKDTDYKEWAHGLKKAGYATDPTYAARLIKIIEENNLLLYDRMAGEIPMVALEKERAKTAGHKTLADISPKRKVEYRNGLRSIIVVEGDTFEGIAKELGMSDWELYTYNDYAKGFQPRPNEILYVEYKPRKADRKHKTYKAENGDTMHFIAQRFGVKLKPLYGRNRMKKGDEPKPGDVIYLRNKKPNKIQKEESQVQ